MLPLCPPFPKSNYSYFKIYIVPVSLEPLFRVTLGSVCTGSWGLGGLSAKNCFSAGQCGVLLISAKARHAAMNKALPQGQGKTSHTWQIQTFKIYFYSPWKWVIMATLRWTQCISVQFYGEQEQHREYICVREGSSLPGMEDETSDGTKHFLACPGLCDWSRLIHQWHIGQQAYLCTQYPSHPCHYIPTPQ